MKNIATLIIVTLIAFSSSNVNAQKVKKEETIVIKPSSECPCGNQTQTMAHILRECTLGPTYTDQDLQDCNSAALNWIQHWRDKI